MAVSSEKTRLIAECFLLAAEKCDEQGAIERNDDGKHYFVPAITNRAFAVELFLKAIILSENKQAHGHKLYDLFCEISSEEQARIIKATEYDESVFRGELKKVSNLFVDMRYIHEREFLDIKTHFLNKITDAAREVSKGKK